jgi:predicted RNase H-like nuclease (RuvC/YqgF family)
MARNKTGALPGMERKAIKEIETLADKYVELRDSRIDPLKKELEAKQKLVDAMHRHGQTVYEFEEDGEPMTVELKSKENVKVKKGSLDNDSDIDDD